MPDDTPILGLPLILAAQAQKHVTHNEALRLLDILVQLSVLDRDRAAPPATPAEGDRYIIAANPTGAWAGQAGRIAAYWGGVWVFVAPRDGWHVWVADENLLVIRDGGVWITLNALPDSTPRLGINATPDATNRFAVASPASLFTHAGSDHRLVLNKATATDTAAILLQTGFSGRAEIGLAGSNALSFKVSADGTSFATALSMQPSGAVALGQGLTVAGDAGIGGNAAITGTATVTGATTLGGNATVGGTATLARAIVTGLTTLNGNLTVAGTTTLASATVTGATTLNGNLTAAGTTTLANATVTGATTLNGNLTAAGTTTLASATVTGATTLNGNLSAAGTTTLASATVTGATTLNGTFSAAGTTTLANATVTGTTTLNGNVTAAGTTTLNGPATLTDATVTGTATLSGPATLSGAVTLSGSVTGAALQASATDGTAGKLLTTGAFGLGSATAPVLANLDATTTLSGLWRTVDVQTTGTWPPVATTTALRLGTLTVTRPDATSLLQSWLQADSATEWTRRYLAGSWSAWSRALPVTGTVAMSGSTPTGAILQRGSNAQGEFVRFADGTQICTQVLAIGPCNLAVGSLFQGASTITWTFPAAFVAAPIVSGLTASTTAWLTAAAPTTTNVGLRGLAASSQATTINAHLTAIGRWV